MSFDWSLAINAATGLFGAAIGGYFTLRAADRSFKLERKASEGDAALQKREAQEVELWRLTHRFRQICGAIEGANNGLLKQMSRLPDPSDEGLWRVMMPTSMSSPPETFSADELLALVRVGQSDQINTLLEIQESLKAVSARVVTYARVREEVTQTYAKDILRGLSDDELSAIDPRFGGVKLLAVDIRNSIQSAYSLMKPAEVKFWGSLSGVHQRIGFSTVLRPRIDASATQP